MRDLAKQFAFERYPEKPNCSDYERARQFITQLAFKHEDVVALYEYGTVQAPGMSDLDFIAVLSDEPQCADLSDFVFLRQVPDYVAKTLDGSILRSMNEMQFKRVRLLGDIQVRRLCGKAIPFDPIFATKQRLVMIADVMDWLPERTLMLGVYASQVRLPVKRLVGCLHSLQHSVKRVLDIVGARNERAVAFVNYLCTLRRDWFSWDCATNLTKLTSLMYEGMAVGAELMRVVAIYLVDHGYYTTTISQPDAYFNIDPGKGFRFTSNSEVAGVTLNSDGVLRVNVPRIWLTHLYLYGTASGIVSDLIRSNMVVGVKAKYGIIEPALRDVLKARIELCNDMAVFLERNDLHGALYRFAHLKRIQCDIEHVGR